MSYAEVSFTIAPVPKTLEGAKILREIETSAHQDSKLVPLLWPAQSSKPEAGSQSTAGQHDEEDARTLEFLLDPVNHYDLVTDNATGQGVAFVWWQEQKGKTEAEWEETYSKRWRSPQMNIALMDATSGARFLKRAKILGDKDVYMLKELYVRPEFQRKGIGARCVKLGIDKADELGLPAYTEGSRQGMGLYLRYGFKEVDRVTVDLGDWGGEKGELNSYGLLYREAKERPGDVRVLH